MRKTCLGLKDSFSKKLLYQNLLTIINIYTVRRMSHLLALQVVILAIGSRFVGTDRSDILFGTHEISALQIERLVPINFQHMEMYEVVIAGFTLISQHRPEHVKRHNDSTQIGIPIRIVGIERNGNLFP